MSRLLLCKCYETHAFSESPAFLFQREHSPAKTLSFQTAAAAGSTRRTRTCSKQWERCEKPLCKLQIINFTCKSALGWPPSCHFLAAPPSFNNIILVLMSTLSPRVVLFTWTVPHWSHSVCSVSNICAPALLFCCWWYVWESLTQWAAWICTYNLQSIHGWTLLLDLGKCLQWCLLVSGTLPDSHSAVQLTKEFDA